MRSFSHPFAQRGIALITSLLMLVIITLLALSMYRGIGLQEKIAGNTREKQRSLQTAESALQYAEWWLNWFPSQPGNSLATIIPIAPANTCSGTHYNANVVTNMVVCSNALTNAATSLPWPGAGDYTPPAMTVAAGGGVVSAGGDINYAGTSALYIQYLPASSSGTTNVFQITAVGYGGSANGASVLQSTYSLTLTGSGSGATSATSATGFSTSY